MAEEFDSNTIAKLGWCQGAVLCDELAVCARRMCPAGTTVDASDWLVVVSHDCDIVNFSLDKEPVIEVLRLRVSGTDKVDRLQASGRNPRMLQLTAEVNEVKHVLCCAVHERWTVPRDLLMRGGPAHALPRKDSKLVAEWLAKRYIRAAFPSAFDQRWRRKHKEWQNLLRDQSDWTQGVYLRLNTLDELPAETPYKCNLLVAVPQDRRPTSSWPEKRREIEDRFTAYWDQFSPAIECVEVEVLATDEITLADLELYQRFDADWISFEDETATTPPVVAY